MNPCAPNMDMKSMAMVDEAHQEPTESSRATKRLKTKEVIGFSDKDVADIQFPHKVFQSYKEIID